MAGSGERCAACLCNKSRLEASVPQDASGGLADRLSEAFMTRTNVPLTEHQRVVLTKPVAAERLEPGDVGTVVHVYGDRSAYEVEFTTLDGGTAAVVTVEAADVRPVSRDEITHARTLES